MFKYDKISNADMESKKVSGRANLFLIWSTVNSSPWFVVVANDEISSKFLAMVNAANQLRMPEPEEIPVSDRILPASVMQGNDTKH